ncbi:MAG: protein kinase, partial [Deltaproteobacteria bacterium]|nr:protein kinase [Deltaproteobacteria bacterium]
RALREEKLDRKDIKDVFIQICETLDKTHRANIIHRDLKPDNVVLETKETGGYFVKIVDFGIAKIMENKASNLTETGVILGTPYYMSPEQARGDQLDNRSDIYALGVMMYRAFAGRLPFVADTAMGVLTRHLTQQPELPSRLTDMDPALERLILRCLEKKPVDRLQSMADVAEALQSVPDTYQSQRNNPTIDERSGALMAAQIREATGSDQAPISMPTPTKVATPQAMAARHGDPPGQVVESSEAPAVGDSGSTEHPSVIPPPLPTPGMAAQASATPADASGPVLYAGPGGGPPMSAGPLQPQGGAMASGQMPVGGAAAPASTEQPAMGAMLDAGSTGDPLPIHLQGEAPTHRGVVSSRTSARSLRDPRGRSALWIGVAVLMAALGGTAAYVMFGPTTPAAPATGSPSTQPSSSSPEEVVDLPEVSPWASADPLETPGSADPSAEPDPDSSAAPATSSSGKPTTRPKGGVRPPPPEEEEEEVQPEIRSPFD